MRNVPRATRRQVLRGAGGFALALPWLPSLLPRDADAGVSPFAQKRFVAFATEHGAIWSDSMHPAESTLTQTQQYGGRQIRRGDLVRTDEGGVGRISTVLSGDGTRLTAALAAKMN